MSCLCDHEKVQFVLPVYLCNTFECEFFRVLYYGRDVYFLHSSLSLSLSCVLG